jgi:hypothetical protein
VNTQGDPIVDVANITGQQAISSLLATFGFLPLTVCCGYLAAWMVNLHGFRHRSFVERIFWSIPLSFALSTILSVLIGKFISLDAVAVFYVLSAIGFLAILVWEGFALRRARRTWSFGLRPLGGAALALAILWIVLVIVSLVDFQRGQNLYSSLFLWDHASRINWTESILRTGIPPVNSMYFYQHPAPMRNYYFWYVLCAATAKLFHLPARAVVTASCVWAGFALAAVAGLYLKYFLCVGARLRRQFLLAISLLAVTGLDICVNFVEVFFLHRPMPLDLEWWSHDEIFSWYGSLLWVPHHVTALVCCMFAFLLAWLSQSTREHGRWVEAAFIGAALASAFGMSIFVPLGFFLVTIVWAIWQIAVMRTFRPVARMAAGGLLALVLLVPYLAELTHNTSTTNAGALADVSAGNLMQHTSASHSGSLFGLGIREMIPANALLRIGFVHSVYLAHPNLTRNITKLILLAPGYAIELGFYAVVLLIYFVPSLRPARQLSAAQRTLLFLAAAILPFVTFIRSTVLASNDFGWRAVLLLQFPLLLLASDLLINWKSAVSDGVLTPRQKQFRSLAQATLVIGVISTISQAMLLRFDCPLLEFGFRARHSAQSGIVSHNAYISYLGYDELNRVAAPNSIAQFNPANPWSVWKSFDFANVVHPIAISSNELWCGATLGGDPSGCPGMIAAIDPLFKGAPADRARAVCHQYGIQYLVAKVYDPAWTDKTSWVWTLKPVVADPEFRALDCQR